MTVLLSFTSKVLKYSAVIVIQQVVFQAALCIIHCRANNVPYGEFALSQAAIIVEMVPVVTRSIVVNVLRELGTFGTVRCTVTVTYSEVSTCESMSSSHDLPRCVE